MMTYKAISKLHCLPLLHSSPDPTESPFPPDFTHQITSNSSYYEGISAIDEETIDDQYK